MELEKLQKIVAKILNVDTSEVALDTTFAEDLGADSLDFYQILIEVEKTFAVHIDRETAEKIITVEDAIVVIQKLKF